MYRAFFLIGVVCCISLAGISQNSVPAPTPVPAPGRESTNKSLVVFLPGLNARIMDVDEQYRNIDGSAFISDNWTNGTVVLTNGKLVKDLRLKFDLYANRLYFQREAITYEFVDTIRDFYLELTEGNTLGVSFRSQFPPVDKNGKNTFYEVLADGRYVLAKFRNKILRPVREYGGTQRDSFGEREMLYALLPGNKMIKINRGVKELARAIPEQASRIREYAKENDTKLRTDDSIISLFVYLNKPER